MVELASHTHIYTHHHTTGTYRNTFTSLEIKKTFTLVLHTQIKLNRFKMNNTHCCKKNLQNLFIFEEFRARLPS